jgi:N-acetylneuraminic acid mutarotase
MLYAVGGAGNGFFSTVDAYDPVANSWTAKAPLSAPRAYLAAGVVNGSLYAVGGDVDQNGLEVVVGTVEAYDPVANTWTQKPPMPTPRGVLAAAGVNGVLYAVSGTACCGLGLVGIVEAYQP